MKKLLIFLLAVCLVLPNASFVLADDEIKVTLNNTEISFDQPPILQNDRVLVPLRSVCEALGADVYFWEDNEIICIVKNKVKILMAAEDFQFVVFEGKYEEFVTKKDSFEYGKDITDLDVAPQIINDRTLLPIRAVCEALGASVEWDNDTKTVKLTCDQNIINDVNTDKAFYDKYKNAYKDDKNKIFGFKYDSVAVINFNVTGDGDLKTIPPIIKNRLKGLGYYKAAVNIIGNKVEVKFPCKDSAQIIKISDDLSTKAVINVKDEDNNVFIENKDIVSATKVKNLQRNGYNIKIQLNADGQSKLATATEKLIGKKIIFSMDDKVISSPTVQQKIEANEFLLTGFDEDNALSLSNLINNGVLPFDLSLVDCKVVKKI